MSINEECQRLKASVIVSYSLTWESNNR